MRAQVISKDRHDGGTWSCRQRHKWVMGCVWLNVQWRNHHSRLLQPDITFSFGVSSSLKLWQSQLNYRENDYNKFISFQPPLTATTKAWQQYTTHIWQTLSLWERSLSHEKTMPLYPIVFSRLYKSNVNKGIQNWWNGSWIVVWSTHITTWHNTHTKA